MSKRGGARARKASSSRKRGSSSESERIDLDAGTLIREGRFLQFEWNPGARDTFARSFVANAAASQTVRSELHGRLIEALKRVGPIDLIARASALYLTKDPDTYKEWNDDQPAAHIEY